MGPVTVCFSARFISKCFHLSLLPQQLSQTTGGVQIASFQDAASYVVERDFSVPMEWLVFDRHKVHGQIRSLNNSVVNYYYQTLLVKGAPPAPVTVPLKRLAGMHSITVLRRFTIFFLSSCR